MKTDTYKYDVGKSRPVKRARKAERTMMRDVRWHLLIALNDAEIAVHLLQTDEPTIQFALSQVTEIKAVLKAIQSQIDTLETAANAVESRLRSMQRNSQ